MNLLKTLLLYMTMVFVSSVQYSPDPSLLAAASPTIYMAVATATPTASPTPTPAPTINITPNPAYKSIRYGDRGKEVSDLQQKLFEYGYYKGEIDGRFGGQTLESVRLFQRAHGLDADGIAGKATLTVLYESSEVRPAATPEPSAAPGEEHADVITAALPNPDGTTLAPVATETLRPMITNAPLVTFTPAPENTPESSLEPEGTLEPESTPEPENTPEGSLEPEGTPEPETTPKPENTPEGSLEPEGTPEPETTPEGSEEPTASPVPVFMPMEGYVIKLVQEDILVSTAQSASSVASPEPLSPYLYGQSVYLPLMRILEEAKIAVLFSDTLELDEYAFVLGERIYQLNYTENQAGDPTELTVIVDGKPIQLPNEDAQIVGGALYLPAESIEALTGITYTVSEEQMALLVAIPK